MDTRALVEIIVGFLAIVAIGVGFRRTGILQPSDTRPINAIIIYAALPAMIFSAVHPAELNASLLVVAAIAWVVFATSAVLAWLVTRALGLQAPIAGGFILAASLGNTGYIGYPVSAAVLGDEALVQAIFYDIFGTVAALLFVGLYIAQRMGTAEKTVLNPVREALAFPAVLALGLALLLKPIAIPEPVSNGLDTLASLVVPLIMISVGLSLRPRSIRGHALPIAVLSGLRLLAAPLVALAVGLYAPISAETARLVVLQGGMPSMMLTLVIGERFGLDTDFIASAIVVTTVVSLATVPVLQVIMG